MRAPARSALVIAISLETAELFRYEAALDMPSHKNQHKKKGPRHSSRDLLFVSLKEYQAYILVVVRVVVIGGNCLNESNIGCAPAC
jgi:hypothetical protein